MTTRSSCAVALLLLTATGAAADIPGPGPRPVRPHGRGPEASVKQADVVLIRGTDGQAAEMLVPQSWLDGRRGDAAPLFNRPATVAAGVALALGVALAGLWLTRKGSRRGIMVLVVCLGCAGLVGVLGCPPGNDPISRVGTREPWPLERQEDGSLTGEALLTHGSYEKVYVTFRPHDLDALGKPAPKP